MLQYFETVAFISKCISSLVVLRNYGKIIKENILSRAIYPELFLNNRIGNRYSLVEFIDSLSKPKTK